jgi:hypothetical protein
VGLCLHGLVCYRPRQPVGVDNLSCGFIVQVARAADFRSLAAMEEAAGKWTVEETRSGGTRDIRWKDGQSELRLVWNGGKNRVVARYTNGRKLGKFPFYESPLIRMQPGDPPRAGGRRTAAGEVSGS